MGEAYCWGRNSYGQLGNGSIVESVTPVSVSSLNAAVQVSAGLYFSCGVRSFGTVYCWGTGSSGQLGNGFPWSNVPLRVMWPVLD